MQNHKKIKGIVNLILTKTFFAIGDFIDVSPTDVSSNDVSSNDVSSNDVSSTDVSSTDVSSTDVSSTDVSSMLTEATSNVVPERSSSSRIQIANER